MSIKIENVIPSDENGRLIMEWRNDETTRKMSFNQGEKVWDSFKKEFYEHYFKNIPLFATIDDEKVCFISFIYNEDHLVIGINMSPKFRGKKLSTPIIKSAIEFIKTYIEKDVETENKKINRVVAKIKENNIASVKTFERAGFVYKNTVGGVHEYYFEI